MSRNKINYEASERGYHTQVPNIVWHKGLSVYDLWLYMTLRRVAGDNGQSFMATRTLATLANMSVGRVSRGKARLLDAGLICIERKKRSEKGWAVDHITIVDIWPENMAHFVNSSLDEQKCSSHEQYCSPGETEEYPLKKNNEEEEYISLEELAAANPDLTASIDYKSPDKPLSRQMWDAIVEGLHLKVVNRGQMNQSIKKLTTVGYTPQDVRDYAAWELTQPFWRESGRMPALSTLMNNIDGWAFHGKEGSKPITVAEYVMNKEQMTRRATACWDDEGKEVCRQTLDDENLHKYCVMCPKWEKEGV